MKNGLNVSLYRQDLPQQNAQGKTLVIACPEQGAPELLYFGDALPKTTDLNSLYLSQQAAIPQAMMDKPTPMSLIPEAGRGWLQTAGVEAMAADRPAWAACWTLVDVEEQQNGFLIRLEDKVAQLSVALNIGLLPSGVLRQQLTLSNQGQADVTVQRLACTLPVASKCTERMGFYGRWCQEFQQERSDWYATWLQENRNGRNSQANFPAVIVGEQGFGEQQGELVGAQQGAITLHALEDYIKRKQEQAGQEKLKQELSKN